MNATRCFAALIFSYCMLFALLPKVQAQSDPIRCKQITDIASMERRAAQHKRMSQYYKKTASELIDVVYHRCEWDVNPSVRALSGKVTTYFIALKEASQVVFDLDDQMIVDSVWKKNTLLAFTRKDNTLIINLPSSIAAQSLDSVSIQYHGVPPSTGFGSFAQTFHETNPVIWTLSEPYGASDWWPCKNALDDKIDSVDVYLRYPIGNKGVSNGLRTELIQDSDSTEMSHWKHRYPIASYLLCFAVTNYQEFNDSVQLGSISLPMQTFCYPESYDLFYNNTQSTLDAIQFFHSIFGDYPFIREKYGHTQFSWGGGEEHQTNSFVINPGTSLCAHELAHQWFGDKITCGSWEDIWLNEGFATHLASMFMESRNPDNVYEVRQQEIELITRDGGGSVKVDDTNNVNRIFNNRLTYIKGSHLLYQLRFMLGDMAFFKAIRAYQADTSLQYHFAKTKDLKRHLEEESGQNLDSFFRQWFEGEGNPSYEVHWAQIGQKTVKFKVSQTTSNPSVAFFNMPIALKFKNGAAEKTVVVNLDAKESVFTKEIGFVADGLIIDPEYWLICRDNKAVYEDNIEAIEQNALVFPNPFGASFSLLLQHFNSPYVQLAVYNLLGQRIFEQQYTLFQGKELINISSEGWASGKYLLQISTADAIVNTFSLEKL